MQLQTWTAFASCLVSHVAKHLGTGCCRSRIWGGRGVCVAAGGVVGPVLVFWRPAGFWCPGGVKGHFFAGFLAVWRGVLCECRSNRGGRGVVWRLVASVRGCWCCRIRSGSGCTCALPG